MWLKRVIIASVCVLTLGAVVLFVPYLIGAFYNGGSVFNHVPPMVVQPNQPLPLELRVKEFGPRPFLSGSKYKNFRCFFRLTGETKWRHEQMQSLPPEPAYEYVLSVDVPGLPQGNHESLEYYFVFLNAGEMNTHGALGGGPYIVPFAASKSLELKLP